MALNKEDIQAIAQELNNLQKTEKTTTPSAHAQTGANCEMDHKTKNAKPGGKPTNHDFIKILAYIGLFVFWASVFVILLAKLWAYI